MKRIVSMVLVVISTSTLAGGVTEWVNVAELWSYNSGDIRVILASPHSDPDGCTHSGAAHLSASADKSVYTTLLTALTTNKQVNLYLSGCLTVSGVTAANISRVAIR